MNRLLRQFFFLAAVACSAQYALAQRTNQIVDGRKVQKPWSEVVGHEVVVEGLAWGAIEKGLGQHVVLADNTVYVRKIDYIKHNAKGRLVRVVGTLRTEHVAKAKFGDQGFNKDIDYFYIDVTKWEIIEHVSKPWMEEVLPAKRR